MSSRRPHPAAAASAGAAATGRADLVRAYVAGGEAALRAMARLLGYQAERTAPQPSGPAERATAFRPPPAEVEPEAWAPIPFWRLVRIEYREPPPVRPPAAGGGPVGVAGLGLEPGRRPVAPPLAPPARLWPPLWPRLASAVPSRDVDVAALVERWSRGRPVRRIPFRAVAAWSPRVTVLVDRSLRLVPFWRDQDRLLDLLCRRFGRSAVREVVYEDGYARPWRERRKWHESPAVEPGEPVLALSDLGFYAGAPQRSVWATLGRRLQRERVRRAALVPVPADRWLAAPARLWSAVDWERPARAPRVVGRPDPGRLAERTRRLLALLSFAARIEPGLLRAVRRSLPAAEADAGTEADAWASTTLDASFSPAAATAADERAGLRELFVLEPAAVKKQLVEAMRRWRAGLPEEIWLDEVLALHAGAMLPPGALAPEEIARARSLVHRLAATAVARSRVPEQEARAVQGYALRFLERQPAQVWADPELRPLLKQTLEVFWEGQGEPPLPAGVGPEVLEGAESPPGRWWLYQVTGGARLLPAPPPAPTGSPLAELVSANGLVKVESGFRPASPRPSDAPEPIALPGAARVTLRADRSVAVLERLSRPSWASAVGRDRFGLWASFEVEGVAQRMRWLPPGRFRMGSPEDEPGRWEAEGPVHEVTLRRGFWLADTPCTQALWEAVTGENPSEFRTPDRPVEQVSWDDCRSFCGALNERIPGFGARLPAEAEWEYACRAGTEAATYAGGIEIRGLNDAPVLDAIAWYGGNSGVEPDFPNAFDSSGWKEKQYLHERAATHPVGAKSANPWGLYDMLGNVYEWCSDPWRSDYAAGAEDEDPDRGSGRVIRGGSWGSNRVIRGGSWNSNAQYVRAAYRSLVHPSSRWDVLGFRLARGQGALEPGAEPQAGESALGGARRGTRRRSRGAARGAKPP